MTRSREGRDEEAKKRNCPRAGLSDAPRRRHSHRLQPHRRLTSRRLEVRRFEVVVRLPFWRGDWVAAWAGVKTREYGWSASAGERRRRGGGATAATQRRCRGGVERVGCVARRGEGGSA